MSLNASSTRMQECKGRFCSEISISQIFSSVIFVIIFSWLLDYSKFWLSFFSLKSSLKLSHFFLHLLLMLNLLRKTSKNSLKRTFHSVTKIIFSWCAQRARTKNCKNPSRKVVIRKTVFLTSVEGVQVGVWEWDMA